MSITIHRYYVGIGAVPIVIEGMRNSWESWEKGDSEERNDNVFIIGENDYALALRLLKAGKDHGKFLRQIPAVLDISAPEYWWKEADQYKVGTVSNSTSMMHTLGKNEFTRDMFNFENLSDDYIDSYLILLNKLRSEWVNAGRKKSSKEWRAVIQLTAQSWIYKRTLSLNYQVLRDMYFARKNHKLHEWRDFCAWLETLPYSKFITEA